MDLVNKVELNYRNRRNDCEFNSTNLCSSKPVESVHRLVQMGTEWNKCLLFHCSYHVLSVPCFGMEWFYVKCSHWNATLQCSTFATLQNKVEHLHSHMNGAVIPERIRVKTFIKRLLFSFSRQGSFNRMNRVMSPFRSNMTQWMKKMLILLKVEH